MQEGVSTQGQQGGPSCPCRKPRDSGAPRVSPVPTSHCPCAEPKYNNSDSWKEKSNAHEQIEEEEKEECEWKRRGGEEEEEKRERKGEGKKTHSNPSIQRELVLTF